jgi:hypothetical protein
MVLATWLSWTLDLLMFVLCLDKQVEDPTVAFMV